MSTVATITKVAGTVVGKTVHTVTHPLESAAYAVGLAKGAAGAVTGRGDQSTAGPVRSDPEPSTPVADTPDPVATAEAVTAIEPEDAMSDAPTAAPSAEPEIKTPAGTTAAGPGYNPDTAETDLHQPGTEPLLDPSLTKAVKSEAETLAKAAEPPTKNEG